AREKHKGHNGYQGSLANIVEMNAQFAHIRAFLPIAAEALGRYKLRTSLSVLGVVLGVAAVIAMTSVTDGARREALDQVEALGLDNLVARNRTLTLGEARGAAPPGLTVGDAAVLPAMVPWSAGV